MSQMKKNKIQKYFGIDDVPEIKNKSYKKYNYKKTDYIDQDKMTDDEINEKLVGYIEAKNILEVPIKTNVRYFTTDAKGIQKFRVGGVIESINKMDGTLVISNGSASWSVCVEGNIFFVKEQNNDKLIEEYCEKIKEIKHQNKLLLMELADAKIKYEIKIKKLENRLAVYKAKLE
jgi:hypothetical protein